MENQDSNPILYVLDSKAFCCFLFLVKWTEKYIHIEYNIRSVGK